jgi:hypothetical protein
MSKDSLQSIGNAIFRIGDAAFVQCMEYLLPSDLCQIVQTTKRIDWDKLLDSNWEILTRLRWKTHGRTKKSLSVATWKQAYRLLHSRNQIPEGKFSGKNHFVFAQGILSNVASSWVMLSHGNNALLRSSNFQRSTLNVIEVRLCIQNLFSSEIKFDFQSSSVRIVAFHSDELENDELLTSSYRRIAFNGVADDSNVGGKSNNLTVSSQVLKPLEFAVFAFTCFCPCSVTNEPDFLTMIERIEVAITTKNKDSRTFDQEEKIVLRMINDAIIWNMYSTLPNGVVLLRERPMVTAV